MKLATLKDGSRDGQLAVVSHDGALAHHAAGIAGTLQQLLDDWNFVAPQLQDLYVTLNQGKARHAFAFDPRLAQAPLPRAFRWAQAALPAGGAASPGRAARTRGDAVAVHAAGDVFGAPIDTLEASGGPAWLVPGLAVATGDIAAGCAPAVALEGVRLVLLSATWLVPGADGRVQACRTAFAPLALTPDELPPGWHAGAVQPWLRVAGQARALPTPGASPGALIAALARSSRLGAGALVGWRVALPGEGEGAAAAASAAAVAVAAVATDDDAQAAAAAEAVADLACDATDAAWARLQPGEACEIGAAVGSDTPSRGAAGAPESPFGLLLQRLAAPPPAAPPPGREG